METKTRNKVYPLAMTAVMAAVICVLGPLSIPVGPVPISFTNFAIYITLYVLGWKRGTVSYLVYVLIGMVECLCSPGTPAAWPSWPAQRAAISSVSSPWR